MALADRAVALAQDVAAKINTLAARPPTGVKLVEQFVYTDANVARPNVPAYVCLNWSGPAGSNGSAPANMAAGDTWDMEVF